MQGVVDEWFFHIERRPPRAGELGWWVSPDDTDDAILEKVIQGRGTPYPGSPSGFGWVAPHDFEPGPDEEGDVTVTIVLDEKKGREP